MKVIHDKTPHQRTIGYIFVILGTLSLAFGFISFNTFYFIKEIFGDTIPTEIDLGFITFHDPFRLLIIFPAIYMSIALLKLVTGIGILRKQRWAQYFALIGAFFFFFSFPFGTIFSIYILYAFLNDQTMKGFGFNGNSTSSVEK
ncbi:MAG: hypothetical protein RJQ09_03840 [Cyclobacteriaceae bacterium]